MILIDFCFLNSATFTINKIYLIKSKSNFQWKVKLNHQLLLELPLLLLHLFWVNLSKKEIKI